MKIAIVGAGALGRLYAALLALSGKHEVNLVGGSHSPLAHFQTYGLALNVSPKINTKLPFNDTILTNMNFGLADLSQAEVVLIAVKGYQTQWATDVARDILHPNGLAISLQNGLGNLEILAARLGHSRVLQAVTSLGATVLPNGVLLAGIGQTTFDLPSNDYHHRLIEILANELALLQLETLVTPQIANFVWAKLIVNCAINPLTALLRCKNGELLENSASLELMDSLAIEARQVARQSKIVLPYEDATAQVRKVAELTAANTSSMLADILRGSQTEIEMINGAIVKIGKQLNVPTPFNQSVLWLVKALEKANKNFT